MSRLTSSNLNLTILAWYIGKWIELIKEFDIDISNIDYINSIGSVVVFKDDTSRLSVSGEYGFYYFSGNFNNNIFTVSKQWFYNQNVLVSNIGFSIVEQYFHNEEIFVLNYKYYRYENGSYQDQCGSKSEFANYNNYDSDRESYPISSLINTKLTSTPLLQIQYNSNFNLYYGLTIHNDDDLYIWTFIHTNSTDSVEVCNQRRVRGNYGDYINLLWFWKHDICFCLNYRFVLGWNSSNQYVITSYSMPSYSMYFDTSFMWQSETSNEVRILGWNNDSIDSQKQLKCLYFEDITSDKAPIDESSSFSDVNNILEQKDQEIAPGHANIYLNIVIVNNNYSRILLIYSYNSSGFDYLYTSNTDILAISRKGNLWVDVTSSYDNFIDPDGMLKSGKENPTTKQYLNYYFKDNTEIYPFSIASSNGNLTHVKVFDLIWND